MKPRTHQAGSGAGLVGTYGGDLASNYVCTIPNYMVPRLHADTHRACSQPYLHAACSQPYLHAACNDLTIYVCMHIISSYVHS